MKELKKRIWTIAAAVIVVAAAFGMGAVWKGTRGGLVQEKEAITQDILQQQIQEIGELATAKYYYSNMGRYENTLQVLSLIHICHQTRAVLPSWTLCHQPCSKEYDRSRSVADLSAGGI